MRKTAPGTATPEHAASQGGVPAGAQAGPPAGSQPPGGGSWRWEGGRGWVEVHPAAADQPSAPQAAPQTAPDSAQATPRTE